MRLVDSLCPTRYSIRDSNESMKRLEVVVEAGGTGSEKHSQEHYRILDQLAFL